MRDVNFGRIAGIEIHDGEPSVGPSSLVTRTVTFSGESAGRQAPQTDDYQLKRPLIELFLHFDRIGNGRISYIDIKAGLPCFMAVEEAVGSATLLGDERSGERGEVR